MREDKSKLQLIGEIAQANNKNLELIEELNNKEEIERLHNIINELEKWLKERLDKLDIKGYDDEIFAGLELTLDKLKELKESNIEILDLSVIQKLNITKEKNCHNNWKWKCNDYNISMPQKIMGDKINEIIDYIKAKEK